MQHDRDQLVGVVDAARWSGDPRSPLVLEGAAESGLAGGDPRLHLAIAQGLRERRALRTLVASIEAHGAGSLEVLASVREAEDAAGPLAQRVYHGVLRARVAAAGEESPQKVRPPWAMGRTVRPWVVIGDAGWDVTTQLAPPASIRGYRAYESRYLAFVWPRPGPMIATESLDADIAQISAMGVHAMGMVARGACEGARELTLAWLLKVCPQLEDPVVVWATLPQDGEERCVPRSQRDSTETSDETLGAAATVFSSLREAWSQECGFERGCLSTTDVRTLERAWEDEDARTAPEYSLWSRLVRDPSSSDDRSPAGRPVAAWASRARASSSFWPSLSTGLMERLDAGSADMLLSARELSWLQEYCPEGRAIPPAVRLASVVSQLQVGNSLGAVDAALEAEAVRLCDYLYDESARLVCHAELRLAVRDTNRFEFGRATRWLERWSEERRDAPGILLWGRVLSSRGQHAAFRGEHAAAIDLFTRALRVFENLSDSDQLDREWSQTATYHAIAVMDAPDSSADSAGRAVSWVASLDEASITRLSSSADRDTQYAHHLLLRYLMQHGSRAEKLAYLEGISEWQDLRGHPWPLVAAYRAMLLHGEGMTRPARSLMRAACARTLHPAFGPTVRMIGVTLGVILRGWGDSDERLLDQIARLRSELPAAHDRLAGLERLARGEVTWPGPLSVMARALPFNFR